MQREYSLHQRGHGGFAVIFSREESIGEEKTGKIH